MQHIGQKVALDLHRMAAVHASARQIVANHRFAPVHHTLDDHVLGTHLKQSIHVLLHELNRNVLPLVGDAREDARLGEVGREHVGTVHQAARGIAHLIGVRGVLGAAVAHNGVHDVQGARVLTVEALDHRHLLGRTQKARVHTVQIDALLLPGIQVVVQHLGSIVHVEDGELGVGREQGRGHGAHVHARGAEHGDGDAKRAFSVAAHVVHGRHARNDRALTLEKNRILAGDLVGHGNPSFIRGLMDQRT